ncbi:MAG: erythrose-4-phosphate dehydrogenase [Gammaproteobacteria bacterium]|nr:erythrose-4-phosphate dehydrogenase [Gammaproteobacteria bacterium]
MSFRIAINGYGRIGRCILRAFYESSFNHPVDDDKTLNNNYADLRIVAINDLADLENLTHLTRFDSTHGRFLGEVKTRGGSLIINKDEIFVSQIEHVQDLDWKELNVDLVLECSGTFGDRISAEQHLKNGAKAVLLSQPGDSDVDATIVYGINDSELKSNHRIVSCASCTTNCIVPVLYTLNRAFGIDSGIIDTIHSAMNDQPVIDSYHGKDLRKTRSAMHSMIPVGTALAKGITRILPNLSGRLEARAIRIPTINVSAMQVTIALNSEADANIINTALEEASHKLPNNILGVTREPLASCDFNHDPRSVIVDLNQTLVVRKKVVSLFLWFDNEWAYANRMLDVAQVLLNRRAQ